MLEGTGPVSKIQKQMELSEGLIRVVASGSDQVLVHCVVAGPPGVGKTTLVTRICDEIREATGRRYMLAQGSSYALMEALYRLRNGGTVIVDDADALITGGGERQANCVKQVLLPKRERTIVNSTLEAAKNQERESPKDSILPPRFVTKAGVIWLTNNDLADMRSVPAKARPHVAAIKDRLAGRIINLPRNQRDILDYVLHVCTAGGLLKTRFNLTARESMEVMEYIIKTAPRRETLSIRVVQAIAAMRKQDPASWRDVFDAELSEEPIHEMTLPEVPFVGNRKQREQHIALRDAAEALRRANMEIRLASSPADRAAAQQRQQEAEHRLAMNRERAAPLIRQMHEQREIERQFGLRR